MPEKWIKTACTQHKENLLAKLVQPRIRHRQKQKMAIDIAFTKDSILYGTEIDNSV